MTPIDWETIWQQLEDAFEAYGRKLKGRQAWVDVLFEYEYMDVQEAIRLFVKYNDHPPKPSQLLQEVKKLLHSREKSTTLDIKDEETKPEAPEIVKRAYMTYIRHSLGVHLPIGGTEGLESMPLEQAMQIMKKSADSCGMTKLLPNEVKNIDRGI